jgi:1-acyl-sn-glycerol-3-phosphate acyltransferase
MSPDSDSTFDINDGTSAPTQRAALAIECGRFLIRAVYGSYTWIALLAIVIPMCLLLAIEPRLDQRRRIARRAARLFFHAIGSPVGIEGAGVDSHYPCVVVANHASYLDGIILTAALPPGFTYLIKRQMAAVPVAGFVLRRLGSAFVDREDMLDRKRIAHTLVGLARRGDALGFFPEGTFDASPGLKPFHLGAFSAAARTKLPVVPIVIHGSRRKLPSKRLLAAPGPLRVRICEPLDPARHESARALMQAARRAMLEHLDEPDLAPPVAQNPPARGPTQARRAASGTRPA